MTSIRYEWHDDKTGRMLELVHVEGTNGSPYGFGEGDKLRQIGSGVSLLRRSR
jgi:hypothetical protein